VWLEPGEHTIRADSPGRRGAEHKVALDAGDRRTLRLALPVEVELVAVETRPLRRVGLTLLGVGAAGLAVGAILGWRAIDRGAAMKSVCENDVCKSEEDHTSYLKLQSEGFALAFGSNLAFIVGAAVSGMGVYGVLAPGRSGASAPAARTISPAASLVPVPGGALGLLGGHW
jgi:hypothetical protein